VFYVAATRATQRLVIGVGGDRGFGVKFEIYVEKYSPPSSTTPQS